MTSNVEENLNEQLPLRFEFTTRAAPVQVEGTVAGRPFYFRARGDEWTFAVSERPGISPVEISSPEDAVGTGWFHSGRIGELREHRASHLTSEEAEELVRSCAAAYCAARAI
ncbi:MAG TPA: hypothetical protein VFS44_08965 [Gemmatimonadaceae bacterium]|nr:hypothetical protein [Gemmatimonadaceae bacterium]